MHDGERMDYCTDASLAGVAGALARTLPPLLTLDLSTPRHGRHTLNGRVTLTDAGRSVLGGERDRVATCGLDKWLGGVHLHAGARIWRWDGARAAIR